MNPPRPLLTLEEALARVAAGAAPHAIKATETVSTFDALGRVLAREVVSLVDVPPLDNTAMDGYALRAADVPAAGTLMPVAQRVAAGQVGAALKPGTAARIFTGAPIPDGADAVVMQEQCEAVPAGPSGSASPDLGQVRVMTVPTAGQWVRRRGEDMRQGAVVLPRGLRMTPQAMGLAATAGAAQVTVVRRPKVAVFSTGDELAMPGEPLRPGAIYNSNRFTLRGLLASAGCEVHDLGIVPDRLDATRAALREAALQCDLIVTSGGVSVGEEDHLRASVAAEGTIENWQVSMKPGKPVAFGQVRRPDATAALFLGLPGNPVSSFVTCLLVGVPLLHVLQGRPRVAPPALPLRAAFDWPRPDKRREFLRVRVNAEGALERFDNMSSGVLSSTVWADGLADIAPGRVVVAGDVVPYLSLSTLLQG
jgi:molybdopterin molybdotransferase